MVLSGMGTPRCNRPLDSDSNFSNLHYDHIAEIDQLPYMYMNSVVVDLVSIKFGETKSCYLELVEFKFGNLNDEHAQRGMHTLS